MCVPAACCATQQGCCSLSAPRGDWAAASRQDAAWGPPTGHTNELQFKSHYMSSLSERVCIEKHEIFWEQVRVLFFYWHKYNFTLLALQEIDCGDPERKRFHCQAAQCATIMLLLGVKLKNWQEEEKQLLDDISKTVAVLQMTYLHHLVEEKDATWRQPSRVFIMTSLKLIQKDTEKKEKRNYETFGLKLDLTIQHI